jgi:hypothetical protein
MLSDIDVVPLAQMIDREADQFLVEIVAAQMIVAVAGQHFDDVALQVDDRDIEGATAEVIDQRLARAAVAAFIRQRRCRRLVDDAYHLQAGDFAGFARRLALRIGKIGGHGNHRLAHRLTQVRLGNVPQSAQDHRRDFLRAVILAGHLYRSELTHSTLDRTYAALGVQRILVARGLADEQAAVVGNTDQRGQNAYTGCHRNDLDSSLPDDGHF